MKKTIASLCRTLGFCLVCLISGAKAQSLPLDNGSIFDAAFSPDGKQIGVCTNSGFQLLDLQTMVVVYSYPIEGGVRFHKWAPDSQRVLLVSWSEATIPVYSLLDIQQNRTLFSFQEEMRWYYSYIIREWEEQPFIYEEIYPRSTKVGHAGNISFSPDGMEMAYITNEGVIRIRDTEKGNIIRDLSISEHHATSLGYFPDQQRIWVGLILDSKTEKENNTRLLYLNSRTGDILDTKQLFHDFPIRGPRLYWVYEFHPDHKYALAISIVEPAGTTHQPFVYHYVVNIEQGDREALIALADSPTIPVLRATFGNSGIIYGLLDAYIEWLVNRYDYMKVERIGPSESLPYYPVPAQPFSPDGRQFLMLGENHIYIVESDTLSYQTISITTTAVTDSVIHENKGEAVASPTELRWQSLYVPKRTSSSGFGYRYHSFGSDVQILDEVHFDLWIHEYAAFYARKSMSGGARPTALGPS